MVADAMELLLLSVVESATMETAAFVGTAVGAVYRAVAPAAVWLGVNEPQFGALAHVATQSTPAFAGSLVTIAETGTVDPVMMMLGGYCAIATAIKGV